MPLTLSKIASQIRKKSRRNVKYLEQLEIIEKQNEVIDSRIKKVELCIAKGKKALVALKVNELNLTAYLEVIQIIHLKSLQNEKLLLQKANEELSKKIESSYVNHEQMEQTILLDASNEDLTFKLMTEETRDIDGILHPVALKNKSKGLDDSLDRLSKQLKDAERFYGDRTSYFEMLKLNQAMATPTQNRRQRRERIQQGQSSFSKIGHTDFVPASSLFNRRESSQ